MTRYFLSKEKRDKWVKKYTSKHDLVGVACGNFLPLLPIYTATVLGKLQL